MTDTIAKHSVGTVVALLIALSPSALQAQDTSMVKKAGAKPRSHQVEVTGCLQKSDEPNEFSITGEDGKTWDLRSRTVKLSQHVGHKVTVTGTRYHETKAEEAKEGKAEKAEGKEAGEKEAREKPDLRVTRLKMISKSCS